MYQYLPDGKHLKEEHLVEAAKMWQALVNDNNEDVTSLEILAAGVANPVLASFLGTEWVRRNTIFGIDKTKDLRKISKIMKPSMKNGSADFSDEALPQITKALTNTVELAEALYNLRECPGFDAKLKDFNGGREKTEDIFAEFQAVQILFQRGAYIHFVDASEKQERDYDVMAVLPNQIAVACEFKCNREGTSFTERTLKNTLDSAVGQLPENIPTLVMVKVPEGFTQGKKLAETFEPFLNKNFFRFPDNNKVSSIVLFRNFLEFEGDKYRYSNSFVQIHNPRATIPLIDIGEFSPFPLSDSRWRYFHQIIGVERLDVGGIKLI